MGPALPTGCCSHASFCLSSNLRYVWACACLSSMGACLGIIIFSSCHARAPVCKTLGMHCVCLCRILRIETAAASQLSRRCLTIRSAPSQSSHIHCATRTQGFLEPRGQVNQVRIHFFTFLGVRGKELWQMLRSGDGLFIPTIRLCAFYYQSG